MRKNLNQKVTQLGVTFLTVCLVVAMLPLNAFATTEVSKSIDIVYSDDDIKKASNNDLYFMATSEKNTFQLEAKEQPSGDKADVTWSGRTYTSDITIDEKGLVTVKEGYNSSNTCYFTATSKEDSNISKQIKINIISPMRLVGLTDNTLELTLSEDGQKTVTKSIKFLPAQYFTYELIDMSSENDEFFSTRLVRGYCYVTAKKPGTAKVTLKDKANNKDLIVTVKVKGVLVNSEDGKTSGMVAKDKKIKLTAIGESDDETFTWSSSDEEIAKVDENGNVTGLKQGRAYIYATSSNGSKGGYKINVKSSENMPYLEGLSVENNTLFKDWTTPTSNFEPTILNYNLDMKNADAWDPSASLKVTYDESKYKVAVYKNGELSTEVKSSGEIIKTLLDVGDTKIVIRVTSLDDEKLYTDYTFNATRPRSSDSRLSNVVPIPDGRELINSPTYRGYAEGTKFKVDQETGELSYSSIAAGQTYRIFLYNDVKSFKLKTSRYNNNSKVRITVDNDKPYMLDTSIDEIDNLSFKDKDIVSVKIEVCSDATYYANQQAEKEEPFEAESTYTFEIQRIDLDFEGVKILKAEKSQGEWGTPIFNKDITSAMIKLPYGEKTVDLTLTASEGAELYKGSVSEANLLTQDEDGNYKLTVTIPDGKLRTSVQIQVVKTLDDGAKLQNKYTFSVYTPYEFAKDTDKIPSKIVDFMAPGSQYTNQLGSFSMYPEKSLLGGGLWSTPISLGNFGGYITYYYDKAIQNNPNNPYGIDFTVFGNSNGGQPFSEPGNVIVSKDGKNWYTLAGSAHYDDNAIWGYELTYNQDGTYKDNKGNSGTLESKYGYPKAEYFPLFNGWGEDKSSLTFKGTLLLNNSKDPYGSSEAAYPDFGYADTHRNTTTVGGNGENVDLRDYKVGNPYSGQYDECGDGFDLDWAVDEDGYPVKLDEIHYIKVQTASFICAGAIGEKSTEVNAVARTDSGETAVGRTAIPTSITVGDKTIELKEGVDTYNVEFTENFDVKVNTSSDANVYINGQRGTTRTYTSKPDKGIIRIIVQEGEKEPAIIYLTNKKVNTVDVNFDADNGEDVITKSIANGETLDYTPEAPTKDGYTFVGWYKDTDDTTTEYKSGATYNESVTYKAKWAHVTMLGAQGKLVVDGKSGIRFGTKIYNDGDEIVEKGTLIIPANLVGEGESLTLNTPKVAKSIGKVNYEVNKEQNFVTYLGTIINIPQAQFERQMTAASYVIYKDKAGNQYTVYSQYPNGSVSVYDLLENDVDWDGKWDETK